MFFSYHHSKQKKEVRGHSFLSSYFSASAVVPRSSFFARTRAFFSFFVTVLSALFAIFVLNFSTRRAVSTIFCFPV